MIRNQFLFNQFGDTFGTSDFQENFSFRVVIGEVGSGGPEDPGSPGGDGGDGGGTGGGGGGGGGIGVDPDQTMSNVYFGANTVMWPGTDPEMGDITSIAAENTPNNVNCQSANWNPHTAKTTKYITELIAMDWGWGSENPIGMDYRDTWITSQGENNIHVFPYPPETPLQGSPFFYSKIENTFQTFPYSRPTPRHSDNIGQGLTQGAWDHDLINNTKDGYVHAFGAAPAEFISCSGYSATAASGSQENCSLAARSRQLFEDKKGHKEAHGDTNTPGQQLAFDYSPTIFNKHLMPFTEENPNNGSNFIPEYTGVVNDADKRHFFMDERLDLYDMNINQYPISGSETWATEADAIFEDGERGFPMGLFLNTAKFNLGRIDIFSGNIHENVFEINFIYDRYYTLKAGFKFLRKKDISGRGLFELSGFFDPDNGSGIHLGGNPTTDPYVEAPDIPGGDETIE